MKKKEQERLGLQKWDVVRNVVSTKINLAMMEMSERATRRNLRIFDKKMKEAIHYLYKEKILKFKPKVRYKYKYAFEQPVNLNEPKEKVADMVLIARNEASKEFVREVIK